MILLHGGKVGYLHGGPGETLKAAQELRPTIFGFVPRFLNRLYDDISKDLCKHALKGLLAKIAFAWKKRDMQQGILRNDTVWDRMIFSKYCALLGGKVRLAMTGSAATNGETLTLMRAVLGCNVSW